MKKLITGLALALPFAVCAADSTPDAAFYQKAAEGGMAEADMGQVAQTKGTRPRVKDFGAMMWPITPPRTKSSKPWQRRKTSIYRRARA
jgi:predicted outer membrane protein